MNYWVIFLTGLTTGGLSCLAMQGGLLASIIANQKEGELESTDTGVKNLTNSFDPLDWVPVALFLATKLIAHTILGFFLGWLGGQLELSLTMRLLFQSLAALFMLGTAFNLLDLHPIFRYLVFQPPRFIRKLLKNTTQGKALFTPAVLGLFTVLIPCGVTQSMEVLAISSGSALAGALIMFFFVLGTSPLFAIVGVATAKLSETFQDRFMKIAAAALIFLSVSSLNGVLIVLDAPITLQKISRPVTSLFSKRDGPAVSAQNAGDVQKITIEARNNGYSPKKLRVNAGQPVELTVRSVDNYSCASYFTLKGFGINLQLGSNDSKTVSFTPKTQGVYQFSCSMGMYVGVLEVI